MKKKVFAVLVVVALLAGMLSAAIPVSAGPSLPDYEIYDAGPELRAWEPTLGRIHGAPTGDVFSGGGSGSAEMADYVPGDTISWLALDDYYGYYYFKQYTLMAVGDNAEIWLSVDYQFPAGDPRNLVVITQEQIDYLLQQVDQNIYPTDTGFFGTPDYHDGSYSLLVQWGYVPPGYYDGDKLVILVDNFRDDNYYDPNYPLYIAGFYSGSFEAYFDRNIINIDAYDWEDRIGPDVARPYLYEGVIAHEFQHLIHSDMDSDEETWVDEGCADFAEFICGYAPALASHIRDTAAYPENSLVVWGDQGGLEILSDYGHAYLWTLYLYERFGEDFIPAMVVNPDNGITGVNSTLAGLGHTETFDELYHDYSVALLIDSEAPGGGAYNFANIDFHLDIGSPDEPNPESYDTPGAPPWGTDYLWITGPRSEIASFAFNGVDYSIFGTPWSSDGDLLWSGTGNLIDNWLITPLDLSGASSATLTLNHYYDIEDYWDFGFVQVSTDGGYTWTSLWDNEGRVTDVTDPNAHPKVKANVPGFTSWSGVFVTSTFDLSPYAGQNIHLAFRYVTDWATLYDGWFIDEIEVTADGSPVFYSDGSSTAPFLDITEVVPIDNNFTVYFVGYEKGGKNTIYHVAELDLDNVTEEGLRAVREVFEDSSRVAMLVTLDAPEGFTGYADYTYEFQMAVPRGPK